MGSVPAGPELSLHHLGLCQKRGCTVPSRQQCKNLYATDLVTLLCGRHKAGKWLRVWASDVLVSCTYMRHDVANTALRRGRQGIAGRNAASADL